MRFKFKKNVLICSLILLGSFCFALAWADEPGAPQDKTAGKVFDIGEVVVTGEGETVTEVTTVETRNREDLDMTNATDVSKALETLPGVAISVGTRNEAYLNVRGFNQRYVPIFYDGIPIYIPNDGYADASELNTGNVSQITLTKGAASVLYGANTMGGVINIVSMKPQRPFEGSYGLEWSENGLSGTLNLGSRQKYFYAMAGITGMDSSGYEMSDDFTPTPIAAWYEDGNERDNSDMQSVSGSFKVGLTPWEGHEYAVGVQHVTSERGLPPNIYPAEGQRFWRFTEWEKTTYYFIGDTKITDGLSAKTRLYHDTYYNVLDSYDDETYITQNMGFAWHSTYDDHTDGGSLVLRTTYIPRNTLSLSAHYKDDVHQEQDDYEDPWERYEGETYSFGIEDDIKILDSLAFVLGASYDIQKPEYADGGDLRDDDNSWNGLVGLTYKFPDSTKVHASVAKKTRFPTLNELYSSYLGTALPNPNLRKEESVNYEVGLERPFPGDSSAGVAFFYSDIEDLIVRERIGGQWWYDNIGKARYEGFEVTLKTELIPLNTFEAHYTCLNTNDKSDNPADHISESPKHQIYLSDLIKITDWFSLFARAGYKAKQWEENRAGDWIELDDYWTLDAKAMFTFAEYATLEIGARNVFDEYYETGYGFPREGRALFIGIRGNF